MERRPQPLGVGDSQPITHYPSGGRRTNHHLACRTFVYELRHDCVVGDAWRNISHDDVCNTAGNPSGTSGQTT